MSTHTLHDDPAIDDRLRRFAAAVRDSPHNLVSKRAREELLARHVPECVLLSQALPAGEQRVLDLGSGGGFPGMVIAIVRPELEVHLLDATAKKTAFLTEVAEALQIDVRVHTGRAEDLLRTTELAAAFDVVTARAVAPLDRLVGWALPFLTTGGLLYAMKGARWQEELDQARAVIERAGASVVATPDDLGERDGDSSSGSVPRVVIVARGPR